MLSAETIVMNELSAETMTGGMDNPIIMGEFGCVYETVHPHPSSFCAGYL